MGRAHTIQTSFTGGELSPLLRGREDVAKYFTGVEKLENFIVKPQGGAWRRSGTEHIAEVKTSIVGGDDTTASVRLIEFEFSTTQAYILELGNLYMRIYRNGGIVVEADKTITGITAANPAVVSSTAHGYSNGDHVYISGVTGMDELNGRRFTVANKTANDFELSGEDSSNHTSYGSGGVAQKVYEVVTPWATEDLDALYTTQSADVLYLAHPSYETRKITRTAHTSWTVTKFGAENGPYLNLNKTDTTLQLSSITDRALVTATGFTFSDPADVGTYIEYTTGSGVWGLGKVISVDSSTTATVEPQPVFNQSTVGYNFVSTNNQTNTVQGPYSSVFNSKDIGSFVRCKTAAAGVYVWRHITSPDVASSAAANVAIKSSGSAYGSGTEGEAAPANYVADGTDSAGITGRTITATLTASAALFEGSSDDVGRLVRLNFGDDWVDCDITGNSGSSTTVVQVSISDETPVPKDIDGTYDYSNDAKTVFWRLGAWCEATGWPSVITFHQQRLWFASTTASPDTMWSSKVDDYENFQPTDSDSTVTDESAITVTVASDEVNAIKWMTSGPVMLFGTLSAEYQLRSASSFNEPLTPLNLDVKTQTNNGTIASHKPQRIGSSIMFIQRAGRKVMDMRYDFQADSFIGRDLTVMSEHILRDQTNGLRLRYQKNPNSLLWVLTGDGELVGLTFEAEQEVVAWHRQIIGGDSVKVESIAVIPSYTGVVDELWMVVKRTVNSVVVRHVECVVTDFNPTSATDKGTMKYVDSQVSGAATSTTVRGLNHLEGETVQVIVDGDYIGEQAVSSGTITLPETGTTVVAGLKYTSKIKTMPVAPRGDWGAAGGGMKVIPRIMLNLLNSIGFKHGRSDTDLQQDDFRNMGDDMDRSPDLFTGWKEVRLDTQHDREGQYWVVQDQPFPLNVLDLVTVVENAE